MRKKILHKLDGMIQIVCLFKSIVRFDHIEIYIMFVKNHDVNRPLIYVVHSILVDEVTRRVGSL